NRTRKANGRTAGRRAASLLDIHAMRERAERVTRSATDIARIADAVYEGAETQIRSLDEAFSTVNQMTASLKETAQQAESIGVSPGELAAAPGGLWGRTEQVTGNPASLAAAVAQTATASEQGTAAIQGVTATTGEMLVSAQQVLTSIAQMASS